MTLDELIQVVLADDSRAEQQELARRLSIALRIHFRSRWRQDVDVDDLVQDTLMVIFGTMDQLKVRHPKAFLKWVYGIARNKASTKIYQIERTERLSEKLAGRDQTPERGLSSFLMVAESVDLLEQVMDQLTEAQRRAVKDFLDRERGEKPNIDHANLQRARVKLRELLVSAMAAPPVLSMQATPNTPM